MIDVSDYPQLGKSKNYSRFVEESWAWLVSRMNGATVHICCQDVPEVENPDHVYIYLNRKHRNGEAFRWYINGLTPDLNEISEGIRADVYSIPAIELNEAFVKNVLDKQSHYAYINHFPLLARLYPSLKSSYERTVKKLPNSGISAILLCNALPIKECFVHGLDLYYPHYRDYESNPQGKKPPHNEAFDLSCLDLIDKKKFKIQSNNPKVLQKFEEAAIIKKNTQLPSQKRRDALLLITDDGFAVPTAFFINNFINKNPWFRGDINVIHSSTIAPLSQKSRDLIKISGYDRIKFCKIDDDREEHIKNSLSGFVKKAGYHKNIYPSIFTLEVFNVDLWGSDYDKVLLLDPDMLILSSLEDTFGLEAPIVVTEDTTYVNPDKDPARNTGKQFNGGFVLTDHRELAKYPVNIADALIQFCKSYTKSPKLFDQTIMNDFFEHVRTISLVSKIECDVTFAPDRTQMLKRCFPDSVKGHLQPEACSSENTYDKSFTMDVCKIIHYVGSKPWQYSARPYEANYQKLEKLWFKTFLEFYRTHSSRVQSDVFDIFIKNNPRLTQTGKLLSFSPPTSPRKVLTIDKKSILNLLKKEKNYEKGRLIYEQAFHKHPNWPALKREFGFFLLRVGRKSDRVAAFKLFCAAFQGNPKSVAAAGAAALEAINLGYKKHAINYIKAVQNLQPSSAKVKELEKAFKKAFTKPTQSIKIQRHN